MSMHDEIKAAARKSLEDLIKKGVDSKTALKQVQAKYIDDVVDIMANEINSLKIGAITPARLKKMALGDIDLSTNLYRHVQDVNANVLQVINEHTKGLNNAKELALKIYEGYEFNSKELLDVKNKVPKYLFDPLKQMNAKQLKTPALKAAYLQLLDAENEKDLNKALKVAMYERNRYFANRIAQTELHRIHTQAKAKRILEDEGVEVVQIKLSATHPKVDICDYHANLDAYGLGKGCYPKDKAPLPPYHPFCRCIVSNRLDLSLSDAKLIPDDPDLTLMRQFDETDQANIIGTKGMLEKWKHGDGSIIDLVDRTKKPLYRLKYAESVRSKPFIGDLDGNELMEPLSVTIPSLDKVKSIMWQEYQKELSEWIAKVVEPKYKARHEFKLLSLLPEFVFQHKLLQSFDVTEREVFVSDHQLRHAVRVFKSNKGAAFSLDEISQLPYLMENVKWYVDSRHEGSALAIVEVIGGDNQVGKIAIAIQFKKDKRKPKRNVVVTTGKMEAYNLKEASFIEIKE